MPAQMQEQAEAQRLRLLEGDRDPRKLKLARLLGLAAGQALTARADYGYSPETAYGCGDAPGCGD
jgi:hypothetical protein